ncbi:hypothetical protein CSC12_1036 [Klebsiella michiganensis]|nr:hypothetical protein CSC12_1036 [Klebsiella michiganensis]
MSFARQYDFVISYFRYSRNIGENETHWRSRKAGKTADFCRLLNIKC